MVEVDVFAGPLDACPLADFDAVVVVDTSAAGGGGGSGGSGGDAAAPGMTGTVARAAEMCRAAGVPVVAGGVRGLVGWVFDDFGDAFEAHTLDGQPPREFAAEALSRSRPAEVVTVKVVPDDNAPDAERLRHGLSDGALVQLRDGEVSE
jgi:hypothetical protein